MNWNEPTFIQHSRERFQQLNPCTCTFTRNINFGCSYQNSCNTRATGPPFDDVHAARLHTVRSCHSEELLGSAVWAGQLEHIVACFRFKLKGTYDPIHETSVKGPSSGIAKLPSRGSLPRFTPPKIMDSMVFSQSSLDGRPSPGSENLGFYSKDMYR